MNWRRRHGFPLVLPAIALLVLLNGNPNPPPTSMTTAPPLPISQPPLDEEPDDGAPISVNGVIIFLFDERRFSYFVDHTLPALELYFLSCHPNRYPIHIFHEGVDDDKRAEIRSIVPSALRVDFEDVSWHWKTLPHNLSEAQVAQWVAAWKFPKNHPRGYRFMCRFWTGVVWELPSMDKYDYYWRLDTDSTLAGPLAVDPFQRMARRQCEYGYILLRAEAEGFFTGLGDAFERWASMELTPAVHAAVNALVIADGHFWGPMYFNNFEIGTFKHKRSLIYRSLFRFLDAEPPFGIFQHRWGDALLHTLGLWSYLEGNLTLTCHFSPKLVPYAHANWKPPELPVAPGGICRVRN